MKGRVLGVVILFFVMILGVSYAPSITSVLGAPASVQTQLAEVGFDSAEAGGNKDCNPSNPDGGDKDCPGGGQDDQHDHDNGSGNDPDGCDDNNGDNNKCKTSKPTKTPKSTKTPRPDDDGDDDDCEDDDDGGHDGDDDDDCPEPTKKPQPTKTPKPTDTPVSPTKTTVPPTQVPTELPTNMPTATNTEVPPTNTVEPPAATPTETDTTVPTATEEEHPTDEPPTATPTSVPPTDEPRECIVTDIKGRLFYEGNHMSGNPVNGEVTNLSDDPECQDELWAHVFGSMQEPESPGWLESQSYVSTVPISVPPETEDKDITIRVPDAGFCWYQVDLVRTSEERVPPYYSGTDMVDYVFVQGSGCIDKPTEEPEEVAVAVELEVCYEPEVEIEVRKDPVTGYERLWRVWTENGVTQEELDLFWLFEEFDTVVDIQDGSIEPNSRCDVVVSIELEFGIGKAQHDLFVFSSTGSYFRRLTDSDNKDEVSPEWLHSGDIVFSENDLLYLTDSLGRNVQPFEVDGAKLAGDSPAISPRVDRFMTYVDQGLIVTLDLSSGSLFDTGYEGDTPFWTPDGSGLSWFEDGKVKLLDLETGEVSEVQDGQQVVWSPEQDMEGYGHLEQNDQRWWLTPDKDQPSLMTAEAPLSALFAGAEKAYWANQVTHEPLDWEIDPQFGQQVNLQSANEWLTKDVYLATVVESTALASQPVCPNYEDTSLVECLTLAGMDASFGKRAQMAVDNGLIDSIDQYDPVNNGWINWELLELLRSGS